MIFLGILFILAGAGGAVYGVMQNNDAGKQLESLLSTGKTNPGTIFIVIGAAAALLGLIFIIIGLSSRSGKRRETVYVPAPTPAYPPEGYGRAADSYAPESFARPSDAYRPERAPIPDPALHERFYRPAGPVCPQCGAPMESDQRFCMSCGYQLGAPAYTAPAEPAYTAPAAPTYAPPATTVPAYTAPAAPTYAPPAPAAPAAPAGGFSQAGDDDL